MTARGALAALAATLSIATAIPVAHADVGTTLVLQPAAGDKRVKARYLKRALKSLAQAAADSPDVVLADRPVAGTPPAECATNLACLSGAGLLDEAERVVGVLMRSSGDDFEMTLVLLHVPTGSELSRTTVAIAHRALKEAPGPALLAFLAAAPSPAHPQPEVVAPAEPVESAEPVVAAVSPTPASTQPPASTTDAEVPAPTPPPASTTDVEVSSPTDHAARRWTFGLYGGALVPRTDLDVGPSVGVDATWAPTDGGRLRLALAFDWVSLNQQDQAFTSPSDYPRGMTQLRQSSTVYTVNAGVRYGLVALGKIELFAAAAAGVSFNRSRFEAFSSSRHENDARPELTISAGLTGQHGRLYWVARVGWREAVEFDLGASGDVGEHVTGGLMTTVGAGVSL